MEQEPIIPLDDLNTEIKNSYFLDKSIEQVLKEREVLRDKINAAIVEFNENNPGFNLDIQIKVNQIGGNMYKWANIEINLSL